MLCSMQSPSELDRLPLISADSHVQEPPDFFTSRLAARWHGELPTGMRPEADSAIEFGKGIGAHERSHAVMADISRGRSNDAEGRLAVMREDEIGRAHV